MFKSSVKPYQIFGTLIFLGMTFVFLRFAVAIAAFTPQNQPTGYVAQPDVTNYNLTSGNETVFMVDYERQYWSGNLMAYPVNAAGGVDFAAERWTVGAAPVIDAQDFSTGRLIATMKDDGTKIPFRYANLSATQAAYFPTTVINTFSATGANIVDFLRGERTNEGASSMRIRNSVLGDIIHSRPYYVADATNSTVFVGANDGMLHAINANDGSERWAYVPSMLLSKMIDLAKPYGGLSNPHDYFMDGQINIVQIPGSATRRLVGALGAGGKGLFSLDITGSTGLAASTESGVASKVLWEISPTKLNYASPTTTNAYINLGYTYGTPVITKVGGVEAVIIGNGYNNGVGNYSGCTNGTPNYANCGGDYAAYLYVINASTGQLIRAIKAGSSGTAAAPNGLSSPYAVDTNADGSVDLVYAGDLNGTMWKINVVSNTATALLTTSPAQPITSAPGVAAHPSGGYMVNFATGSEFVDSKTDTSVHYVYGVWDGAPVANTNIITQTLEERGHVSGSGASAVTTRVRRVPNAVIPDWTADKGWKVALPAGERVLGEGTFIENGRFYFNSHNPTLFVNIPNPCVMPACANQTSVYGENWLMELDYLSGGTTDHPFLDLDANLLLDDGDRIKYLAGDTKPLGKVTGDPIVGTDGIPVGKFISNGATSQPVLVQLRTLNTTLFTQNPDVPFPYNEVGFGVQGGHFDEDIFYGTPVCGHTTSGGTKATATITVASTGSTKPATLGGIQANGVDVVGPLTVSDLPNGTATSTNATTIKNHVGGGFTATITGTTVTITAPTAGTSYNGIALTILNGTSQTGSPAVPAVYPTGLIVFGGVKTSGTTSAAIARSLSGNSTSVLVGTTNLFEGAITLGRGKTPSQAASAVVTAIGTGGTIQAYLGGDPVTPTCASKPVTTVCLVDTSTFTNGRGVNIGSTSNMNTLTVSTVATAGGSAAVAATGWDNLAPYLTAGSFSGGVDPTIVSNACDYKKHVHQYDDRYNKTGVDMLNASEPAFNLSNGIVSTSTQFKVIAQNQYLNPAVKFNIGSATYQYNVDSGYISIKDFNTTSTLDLATLPTYTRANIGSLVFNLPVDGLSSKDWWGDGDIRSGLIPTTPFCVWNSAGTGDGNLYRPVMPPANGVDGPGVLGNSGNGYAGARHGGALVFQLIKATTPNSAIEQNVSGRPEYGWRVKKDYFDTYVLTEYATYWHHPTGKCYHQTGWIKAADADTAVAAPVAPAVGSTDPKIGDLSGSNGTVSTVTRTVVGNVTTTTITYTNGGVATITETRNADSSTTIITRAANCASAGCETREDIAAAKGTILVGGDERGLQARTGRVSWHELIPE